MITDSLLSRQSSSKKLRRSFYARPALDVAQDLIGKILVRRIEGEEFRARIIEAEAYVGTHDLACHASKGRTKRTEVMFGPPGHAYVYLIYGMYEMFNVVTSAVGDAQAVLIRGAKPLDGRDVDLTGPGKLARALRITRSDNSFDLTKDQLCFLDDPDYQPLLVSTKRIGVNYAGTWKDALLRFLDASCVTVKNGRTVSSRRATR